MKLDQYIRNGVEIVRDEESAAKVGSWYAKHYLRRRTFAPRVSLLQDKHILMNLQEMDKYQLHPPYVPPPGAAFAPEDFSEYARVNPDTFFSGKVEFNAVDWGEKKEEQKAHEPVYEIGSIMRDGPRKLMPPCAACTCYRMCSICQV